MTEQLAQYQQKSAEYAEEEAPIKTFLGIAYKGVETEWNDVAEQMSKLESIFSNNISFGALTNYSDFASEKSAFAGYAQKFEQAFTNCDEFWNVLQDILTVRLRISILIPALPY